MKTLDGLNSAVVRKRTELTGMPAELAALKEQYAALEERNEAMIREKRTVLQDIESATKTRDSLKLLSKQEVKQWSGTSNVFWPGPRKSDFEAHQTRSICFLRCFPGSLPATNRCLLFTTMSFLLALPRPMTFSRVKCRFGSTRWVGEGSIRGILLTAPSQSRARLGRTTPCFADRARRADMKQLQEFFLHNVRGIAASCYLVQLPVVGIPTLHAHCDIQYD